MDINEHDVGGETFGDVHRLEIAQLYRQSSVS